MPTPTPSARKAEITSLARAEARAMTGADTGHDPHPAADLTAAALRAHGTLSAGLGRSVPFTALGPTGDSVHALATFLAVYADQDLAAAA
ncbi:hypothetical protein [Streptomyces aquilus]|uniref:hypothetical protein n=1 Tax=Streptomyces aquilus TaxID=2548456 RepID=UPI0036AADDF3